MVPGKPNGVSMTAGQLVLKLRSTRTFVRAACVLVLWIREVYY